MNKIKNIFYWCIDLVTKKQFKGSWKKGCNYCTGSPDLNHSPVCKKHDTGYRNGGNELDRLYQELLFFIGFLYVYIFPFSVLIWAFYGCITVTFGGYQFCYDVLEKDGKKRSLYTITKGWVKK